MSEAARIAVMTPQDLDLVLGWAALEGWNPGIDDAAAYLQADPQGFLIRRIGDVPVAAISVVNHDPGFAFLGLYLCAPDRRGQGHGWAIWQAGLAHAGDRTIGLDGVPAQEANYARSGFVRVGGTARFQGWLAPGGAAPKVSDGVGALLPDQIPALLAQERVVTGTARDRFLHGWFAKTDTRQTRVLIRHGMVAAYGTLRRCHEGVKIGPFWAIDGDAAAVLLADLGSLTDATLQTMDVPETATELCASLLAQGFVSSLDTARMYMGPAPKASDAPFYAASTPELG